MKTELQKIRVWCECEYCPSKFIHEAPWSDLEMDGYSTCDGYVSWYYLLIACPDCKTCREVEILRD